MHFASRSLARCTVAAALLVAGGGSIANGQEAAVALRRRAIEAGPGSETVSRDATTEQRSGSPQAAPVATTRSRRLAPLASAILPGLGQRLLGNDRAIAYGAAEAVAWIYQIKYRQELRRTERDFRGLARDVARVSFSAERPDGPWEYYESMEAWLESGAFSLGPPGDLIPEPDSTTLNGSRWVLAQRNNGIDPASPASTSSPAYQAAIDEYVARAIRPEFRWSWRNAQLEFDLYRRTIERRNDASRSIGNTVTVLLANHLFSMVDAFATYRLEVVQQGSSIGLRGQIPAGR